MKTAKTSLFVHNVEVSPTGKSDALYVEWQGGLDKHNYLIVKNWDDFNLLVSEFCNVLENHRHNQARRLI
jgi:hypothetical protein